MRNEPNICMCHSNTQSRAICIFILLWFALPFSLSAQERLNEAGSKNNEGAIVEHTSADSRSADLPRMNIFQHWASHGALFKIGSVVLSLISGVVLLMFFWIIHPFTVAPITILGSSALGMVLNRFSFASFGGVLGFCLPYTCFFLYSLGNPTTDVQVSGKDIRDTSDQLPQPAENVVQSGAAVVPEKPEVFNWDGNNLKKEPQTTAESASTLTSVNQGGSSGANIATALSIKIAELQGDLAVVNSKIEAERTRWQVANASINSLTNNKTIPVVRNSPEHVKMYESQVIMKQVEAGAPALKEVKSRLEAMIKSLQDSPPASSTIPKTE